LTAGDNFESEIIVLKLDYEFRGKRSIYPAILRDRDERILVDCGYPGFLPMLERATQAARVPFGEITGVVITHHDYDHYGALREIKEKYPRVAAMSSELDAPHIGGMEKSLRTIKEPDMHGSLSVRIDRALAPHEIMPWCGGTEIIPTPGHMPGHISLFVRRHSTIITGDALIALKGKLHIANPNYAIDPEAAKKSARMLLGMEAERYICYHGGEVIRRTYAPADSLP
jgi:glyoxylase-like metal-dependent hydrolase (beta-lactamase superfamily II)